MTDGEVMVCTKCGVEMNRHAEKVDYTAEPEDPAEFDPELGGVLEEFYSCPQCGGTRSRRAC